MILSQVFHIYLYFIPLREINCILHPYFHIISIHLLLQFISFFFFVSLSRSMHCSVLTFIHFDGFFNFRLAIDLVHWSDSIYWTSDIMKNRFEEGQKCFLFLSRANHNDLAQNWTISMNAQFIISFDWKCSHSVRYSSTSNLLKFAELFVWKADVKSPIRKSNAWSEVTT